MLELRAPVIQKSRQITHARIRHYCRDMCRAVLSYHDCSMGTLSPVHDGFITDDNSFSLRRPYRA
ncbi:MULTISPECIES: hypothetical protein [unclassified Novosphingobium]|uniref:hypothetical protein n=1 Tax=unclassified Novosphingobium TaxID=2644732 RepID=UPI00135BB656|nr:MULTISPECIES: hypothetical protein [unclassified Novosphingobium]